MCVSSWMICVKRHWAIKSFKIDPSYEVFSWSNQSLFLALKLLNTIVKEGFLKVIACNVDSIMVIKLENSLCDWQGDRYRATSTHSLFLIFNSIVLYSWRKFMLISFRGRCFFSVNTNSFSLDIWRMIDFNHIISLYF